MYHLQGCPHQGGCTTSKGGRTTSKGGCTTPTSDQSYHLVSPANWALSFNKSTIAHHTQSTNTACIAQTVHTVSPFAHTNQSALLVDDDNDDTDQDTDAYPMAMLILDHASGKTLEHRQLRQHPDYKDV